MLRCSKVLSDQSVFLWLLHDSAPHNAPLLVLELWLILSHECLMAKDPKRCSNHYERKDQGTIIVIIQNVLVSMMRDSYF